MLNNKSILVTGGTGSFGKKFIETVLVNYNPKKLLSLAAMNSNNSKCNS